MRKASGTFFALALVVFISSCGSKYPSARMGDIKFYVTGIERMNSSAGFSKMTVKIVAENVGKNPVPYPEFSESNLHLHVALIGQVGSEPYSYGSTELIGANINRLPPKFRHEYEAVFEVANTVSDFKLQFELWEYCGLCFDPKMKTTLAFQSSDSFPAFDLPVDRNERFSDLGESIEWCPNTTLSVNKLERVDFAWHKPEDVRTGIILHANFTNLSGQMQSPVSGCERAATLITREGAYYHEWGILASTTLQVPPGSNLNGILLIVMPERLPPNSIENAWLVLRRYQATRSVLWGTSVENDAQIIYEVPSITPITYEEFSSYDFGINVDFFPAP